METSEDLAVHEGAGLRAGLGLVDAADRRRALSVVSACERPAPVT